MGQPRNASPVERDRNTPALPRTIRTTPYACRRQRPSVSASVSFVVVPVASRTEIRAVAASLETWLVFSFARTFDEARSSSETVPARRTESTAVASGAVRLSLNFLAVGPLIASWAVARHALRQVTAIRAPLPMLAGPDRATVGAAGTFAEPGMVTVGPGTVTVGPGTVTVGPGTVTAWKSTTDGVAAEAIVSEAPRWWP